ncbi:MAG: 50S ribosomal protein L29, partial [Verrucomicrobiota bacterium]
MNTSEIRDLTPEELEQLHSDTRREMFNLRMQKTTGALENPSRLRAVRRELARVKTIMNERERNA